jgi:hypothetical protein
VAFEPITAVEILAGKFAKTSIFSKIRNSLDFLNGALGSLGVVDVPNGSFEVDSGGTGVPDNWTLSTYPGGSGSTDTVTPAHGAKGVKLVHPGGVGNGGGYWESDYIPCSPQAPQVIGVIHRASAAGMKNQVIIRHFTAAKTTISDETVYSSTTNPTASTQLLLGFTPPTTGRFYKVKLVGGYTDTDVAGTAYFDGVCFASPSWVSEPLSISSATSTSWVDVGLLSASRSAANNPVPSSLILKVLATVVPDTMYLRVRDGAVYGQEISLTSANNKNAISMAVPIGVGPLHYLQYKVSSGTHSATFYPSLN